MAGYSDLTAYESEDERNAVCAEMARLLCIVPLQLSSAPAPTDASPSGRSPAATGAGESFLTTQGVAP